VLGRQIHKVSLLLYMYYIFKYDVTECIIITIYNVFIVKQHVVCDVKQKMVLILTSELMISKEIVWCEQLAHL